MDRCLRSGRRWEGRMSDAGIGKSDAGAVHAYEGLNRILHEKARLGLLTALLTRGDGASFVELKQLCSLTDGNLNRHLAVLQDAGFVAVQKTKADPVAGESGGKAKRRVQTNVRLTTLGRQTFLAYLDELERVIRDARTAARPATDSSIPPDWAPA